MNGTTNTQTEDTEPVAGCDPMETPPGDADTGDTPETPPSIHPSADPESPAYGAPTGLSVEFGGVLYAVAELIKITSIASPAGTMAAATKEVAYFLDQAGTILIGDSGDMFAGAFDLEANLAAADQLAGQVGALNHTLRKKLGKPRASARLLAGKKLQEECFGASRKSGWWDHKATGLDLVEVIRNPSSPIEKLLAGALVAQKLCLSHSEISEALEGDRKNLMDDKLPHRKMVEVEIADAIIRLFDLGGALGLDIGGAIDEKMAFNSIREDHKPANREAAGGKAY